MFRVNFHGANLYSHGKNKAKHSVKSGPIKCYFWSAFGHFSRSETVD